MSDQLVREMGAFSFDFFAEHGYDNSSGYHDLYLRCLEAWLKAQGYRTSRERSIIYRHRDHRSEAICLARGSIDLYAQNRDHKVAVEFDNGKRLKFKSIEKMNNSDADLLVGVIVGGADGRGVRSNHQRYSEMASSNPSVSRDVWLIILAESSIELLSTRGNAQSGLRSLGSTETGCGMGAGALAGERHRQRAIEDY